VISTRSGAAFRAWSRGLSSVSVIANALRLARTRLDQDVISNSAALADVRLVCIPN
jgi:hypothetical protein